MYLSSVVIIFFLQIKMDFTDSDFSDEEESYVPSKAVEQLKPNVPVITGKKHLNDLKSLLDLDAYQAKLEKKRRKRKAAKARKQGLSSKEAPLVNGAVQTLASRSLGINKPPEIVTFVDHKKRNKSKSSEIHDIVTKEIKVHNGKEVSLKQARFEVFKFGVSGMDKKSQEEANTALALRLGAKPGKNKCVEYKQLKEERLQEKEDKKVQEEERKQSLQGVRKSSKNGLTSKKSENKTKKKRGSKSDFKVGSFDGGMLKLSQKDLSSIKSKK